MTAWRLEVYQPVLCRVAYEFDREPGKGLSVFFDAYFRKLEH